METPRGCIGNQGPSGGWHGALPRCAAWVCWGGRRFSHVASDGLDGRHCGRNSLFDLIASVLVDRPRGSVSPPPIPAARVNLPPVYFHKNSLMAAAPVVLRRAITCGPFRAPERGRPAAPHLPPLPVAAGSGFLCRGTSGLHAAGNWKSGLAAGCWPAGAFGLCLVASTTSAPLCERRGRPGAPGKWPASRGWATGTLPRPGRAARRRRECFRKCSCSSLSRWKT